MSADPRVTHSRRRQLVERALSAIAESPYQNRFALRGAWAFMAWRGDLHRFTEGVDLVDLEDGGDPALAIQTALSTGGWALQADWASASVTRRGFGWTGYSRIAVTTWVAGQATPLRLTVAALPRARRHVDHLRPPSIRRGWVLPPIACLSREWMVVEKLSLLVTYGAAHTRVRDIADLWELQCHFAFDGGALTDAWRACAEGREADILLRAPGDGWKEGFSTARLGRAHREAWEAAMAGATGSCRLPDVAAALAAVGRFALPLLESIRDETAAPHRWRPGEGWTRGLFAVSVPARQATLPLWGHEGSRRHRERASWPAR
jgi:hypothetical protein